MPRFHHDGGDERRVEHEPQAQIGLLLRCFQYLAHGRQFDGGEQVVGGVVPEAVLAHEHLLAALGHDAEGGLVDAVHRLGRGGTAIELNPRLRFGGTVLRHPSGQTFRKLSPVVLDSLLLATRSTAGPPFIAPPRPSPTRSSDFGESYNYLRVSSYRYGSRKP